MGDLAHFFLLSDINIRSVVLGSMVLGAGSALVGVFAYLRKQSLAGDAVSHSVLPGICLGFILVGSKSLPVLLVGAFVSASISLLMVEWLHEKAKIKQDTAIAMILSMFFGGGLVLLSLIQHSGNASQAGIEGFLFGKAAALTGSDLQVFITLSILIVGIVIVFYRQFQVYSFDPLFSKASGMPVISIRLLLNSLMVGAVVVGIQAVGVVLMSAMLIAPAVTARFWTSNLKKMLFISASLGAISGYMGALFSWWFPNAPTGPMIVITAFLLAMISFFFAPRKGWISQKIRRVKNQRIIQEENTLKMIYKLCEEIPNEEKEKQLLRLKVFLKDKKQQASLKLLRKKGDIQKNDDYWCLTPSGNQKARRLTRLHRLWEVYLTRNVGVPIDLVHEEAESLEHIITPELEKYLEKFLNKPTSDPHEKSIPYDDLQ